MTSYEHASQKGSPLQTEKEDTQEKALVREHQFPLQGHEMQRLLLEFPGSLAKHKASLVCQLPRGPVSLQKEKPNLKNVELRGPDSLVGSLPINMLWMKSQE